LNRSVDQECSALSRSIDRQRRAIETEGIWLFLAVLGCWSVFPEGLRLAALWSALILFARRYEARRPGARSFEEEFEGSRQRLRAVPLAPDVREEGLQRLDQLQRSRLSGMRPLTESTSFAIAWAWWGVTLVSTLASLLSP
jgi:hypothetical protein